MSYLFIREKNKIDACGTAYDYKTTKRKNFSGIRKWDTSNVTNMRGLFYNLKNFNEDISAWNTSKVEYRGNWYLKYVYKFFSWNRESKWEGH